MLQAGDTVPSVTLLDEDGRAIPLRGLLERPLVLFFYPKDDTPGCRREACGFRDSYESFREAGAEIVGASSDSASAHERFRTRYALPFRLLGDPGGVARRAFGIPHTWGILPGRATFVIGTDGTIVYAFNSQFEPDAHVANALRALQSLSPAK